MAADAVTMHSIRWKHAIENTAVRVKTKMCVCATYFSEFVACVEMEVRPWGSYSVIGTGEGFVIKTLHVKPGARLSLQSHKHRTEQWCVLRGTATVRIDGATLTLERGGVCTIPIGALHRLGNDRESELVVLEAQFGEFISEDDILRWEDDYGRETEEP